MPTTDDKATSNGDIGFNVYRGSQVRVSFQAGGQIIGPVTVWDENGEPILQVTEGSVVGHNMVRTP